MDDILSSKKLDFEKIKINCLQCSNKKEIIQKIQLGINRIFQTKFKNVSKIIKLIDELKEAENNIKNSKYVKLRKTYGSKSLYSFR